MIESGLFGALGNHLFQYAVVRTVAERNGYNFYADRNKWWDKDVFDIDFGVRDGNLVYTFNDTQEQSFNPEIFNVSDFTLLHGFFQSERYFDPLGTRKWFQPKINKVSEPNLCVIHYRGGDYEHSFWMVNKLPPSYYFEGVKRMLSINSNLEFLVVTDDVESARKVFPDFNITSNSLAEDFATMYYAKYIIIPNSSLSWWSAWLNEDNVVVAPQGWFNYNTNRNVFLPADIKVERFIYI